MNHKCFISYKKEDSWYKDNLVSLFDAKDIIDKSLDRVIASDDAEYIMQVIRNDYLHDSTVTIFLIGAHSSENEGFDYTGRSRNYFIQHEIQASLYNGFMNTRNGILGVVLPQMYEEIYVGSRICSTCGKSHKLVNIMDSTVIREFSRNYYIKPHNRCAWSENDRYCVLSKWDEFFSEPTKYIQAAFDKRSSDVANRIVIRNLR